MRHARRRYRPLAALGAAALCLLAAAGPARAVSFVKPQVLPDLVRESTRAVLARVVDVRYGFDERRLHSTWITLRVDDALYGDDLPEVGGEFTIKIYGAPEPLSDGSRVFLDGTPSYSPGQRYLLLLIKQSRWGFTNTAGLFQGAFRVEDGGRVAGLSSRHPLFGETGLEGLLDGTSGRELEQGAADKRDDAVTYPLLRQAVLELRKRDGGRVAPEEPPPAPPAVDAAEAASDPGNADPLRGQAAPGARR